METIISKSYQGVQTRLLLPKVKDVAGVIGDNYSTRLCFKLPKVYATGWTKYIEFDCYVYREGSGDIQPSYLLDENDSFLIPYEITSAYSGKEVDYNLKFVSNDGEIIEKSEMATLYFRDSTDGVMVEPEPQVDVLTYLYNHAYCEVSYNDGTQEGTSETVLPTLTFTPMNEEGGEIDTITLNVPYLDEYGHILNRFIDKQIVVSVDRISTPDALVTLTDAEIPDMALISESDPNEPYYMDLYMLVGQDPTVASNWYLIHTDNPTFKNVHVSEDVDIAGTLDVGGEAGFDNDVRIGTHSTGATDTHANLTVNGDIHVDSDKKIFVDTIQSQTDANPVTINDDVTLTQSKTLKVDRIESSTGGNNFPVTINDDLAIGTSLYPKTLTSYDKITGKNGLEISNGATLLKGAQGTTIGTENQSANLQVYGNTSLSGTLNTDTITSYNNDNPVTINDQTVIGASGSGNDKSLYVYGITTSTDKITGNNGLDITNGATNLQDTNVGATGQGNAKNLHVYGNSTLDGTLTVGDIATFNDDVDINTGKVLKTDTITSHTLANPVTISDLLQVTDKITGQNGLEIDDKDGNDDDISLVFNEYGLNVAAPSSFDENVVMDKNLTVGTQGANPANTLTVNGNQTVSGTLSAGATTLSSLSTPTITNNNGDAISITEATVNITGSSAINMSGVTTITGNTDIIGTTSVDILDVSNKIINTDSEENIFIDDGLTVSGATDVPSLTINSSGTETNDTILSVHGKSILYNDLTIDTGKKIVVDYIQTKSITGMDTGGKLSIVTPTDVTGDLSSTTNITAPHIIGSTDVSTPKIIGTGTSGALTVTGTPTISGLITGQNGLTVSSGDTSVQKLTVNGTFISGSITDDRTKVIISKNVDAGSNTITASSFLGNATSATTARDYDTTGGTIKGHVETYADTLTTGHVNLVKANSADVPSGTSNTAVPTQAAMVNFVNSSIASQTGKLIGTVDVVDDLGLAVTATNEQIATALLSYYQSQNPTNNDYCYVTLDTEPSTPSKDEYRRFKYNGTAWTYEYTLNNSSFTSQQWEAINSLITNSSYGTVSAISLDVVDIKNFMDNTKIQVPTTTTAGLALISKNNAQAEWKALKTINSTGLVGTDNIQLVSNVSYNSASKAIEKTIDGTTSDVVTLSTVATSGSYNDLLDKPTIGDKILTIYGQNGSDTAQSAQTFNANQSDADKSVTIKADNGLSASTSSNVITLSNAGVRAITDATSGDGIITVNTNGSTANITVYTLPEATASKLGGIKVGTDLSVSSGVLSQSTITRTDDTASGSLTVGGTFAVISDVKSSTTGHVTGQTVKTYTLPATYTPSSHTHGNLTNDGKVGSTADLPLVTGASGAVVAGSVSSPITLSSGVIGHATSGVTAGQYTKVTVDAKGHVTAGTSISSSDVGTAIGASPSVSGQAVIVDSDGSLTFGEAGKVDDVKIYIYDDNQSQFVSSSIVSSKIAQIPIYTQDIALTEVD